MWVPILITVLVIALAAGPVMWLRPTPYQRRIAELRGRAAQLGLRVQLVPLARLGIAGTRADADSVAGYGLPWIQSAEDDNRVIRQLANRPWCLVRGRMNHDLHFSGWWDWLKGKQADREWHESLRRLIGELPDDVIALENNQQGLWLYWWERGGVERAGEMASILKRLKTTSQAL
ncbi:MAG: hypothetical protein WDZ30_08150 [Cellvibrionaceae bacterium]